MAEKYKVVVIGAGPGGYVAAIRAAQLGLKTAIVEREYFGGVCLNWGCIPSKTLLYATELKRRVEESARIGITVDKIGIDLDQLRKHKDATVKRLTGGVKLLLDKAGVSVLNGRASFISRNEIAVVGQDSTIRVKADNFIVATGTTPIDLPMLKRDDKAIIGPRQAIDILTIPKELLIVGAGPIGVELATVYNTLGSKVTIIELLDSVLPLLDADISAASEKALKKQKIGIRLSSKVVSSKIEKGQVVVEIEHDGKQVSETYDMVLVAAGMRPNTETLNLDKAGVKLDTRGFVPVDNRLRTNVSNIYAIGDVNGGVMLAHKASHEGIVASEVIAGAAATADWKSVPYAVFTDPEIAGVGLTEAEAKSSGRKLRVGKFPYQGVGKAVATLATDGFTKVIADAETDELLGVHIFGPHAGDIIYAGTVMMEMDGTSEDLGDMMAVHPTLSEALMEAGLAAHRRAIHIPN
jgi:dihydrolipoamide dehydrogenase